MGPTALLLLRRKACYGFLSPSARLETANLGSNGKHANHTGRLDVHLRFIHVVAKLITRITSNCFPCCYRTTYNNTALTEGKQSVLKSDELERFHLKARETISKRPTPDPYPHPENGNILWQSTPQGKTGNRLSEEDGKGANTDTKRTLKFHIAPLSSKTLTLFKYFNLMWNKPSVYSLLKCHDTLFSSVVSENEVSPYSRPVFLVTISVLRRQNT
jgi:hypothetical protein